MNTRTYEVGDIVVYGPFGGGDRVVVITAWEADVKNGRPGFDGFIVGHPDNKVWGYDAQITRVHPAPALTGLAREDTRCIHCHRPVAQGQQAYVTAWDAPFAAACPACWRMVETATA